MDTPPYVLNHTEGCLYLYGSFFVVIHSKCFSAPVVYCLFGMRKSESC